MSVKRLGLMVAGLAAVLSLLQACSQTLVSQAPPSSVQRLYILNCGEGVAGDISRWSPGVNVGKSMPFADSCYLIKHAQGWMLWDTGRKIAAISVRDDIQVSQGHKFK